MHVACPLHAAPLLRPSSARWCTLPVCRCLNQVSASVPQVCDCLVSSAGGKDARFCGMLMGELHGGGMLS